MGKLIQGDGGRKNPNSTLPSIKIFWGDSCLVYKFSVSHHVVILISSQSVGNVQVCFKKPIKVNKFII